MSCPDELSWSMHADGALRPDEAARVEAHLETCAACRARLAALQRESEHLRSALREQDAAEPIPAFRPPTAGRGALAAGAAVIALASSSLMLASPVRSWLLPELPAWADPFTAARLVDVLIGLIVWLLMEGRSMLMSVVEIAGATLLIAVLLSAVYAGLRTRGAAALSVALATLVLAVPGHALDIRRDEQTVSVAAGETVDDTLIALGRRVEIDGTVTGDLVAFAQRVVIRGVVEGQLVTGAQSVDVEGELGGSVFAFGESVRFSNTSIARNIFGFGRTVSAAESATIGENAVVFASEALLDGRVEIDAHAFAGELGVGGEIGGDLVAYAGEIDVRAPARIGSDLIAHVPEEEALQVAPDATVGGTVRTEIEARRRVPGEEPGAAAEILTTLLRFVAALVAGLVLLGLVRPLQRLSLDGVGETVTAAGIGLVTLVALPIIAVMTAITLIGLPLAMLGVVLWLVGLYFAKIVLAHLIGAKLLERAGRQHQFAIALILGLVLVFVAISIPFVGPVLNFLLTITGLGILVIFIWGLLHDRQQAV